MGNYRIEQDCLGSVRVPRSALWGAQTQRALENFQIGDQKIPVELIRAIAIIKLAVAYGAKTAGLLKNHPLNQREKTVWDVVMEAAQEIVGGKHDGQFPLGIFQTGSGTSTNMNVNEVIANRSAELLGVEKGKKHIHPNDHVNIGQSSNDVIPSAISIACVQMLFKRVIPAIEELRSALVLKRDEFCDIPKTGRTHLMDALPISLAQEFSGYAAQIEEGRKRLEEAIPHLRDNLALGGTAVGTGMGSLRHVSFLIREKIRILTDIPFCETPSPFNAQSNADMFVDLTGRIRTIAGSLYKVANDVRWMGSGPESGLNELYLPALQPGSSLMPGKINPVIPEAVMQACNQIEGLDTAIVAANKASNFQLCTALPLIAANLIEMMKLLAGASEHLAQKCIAGLRANTEHMKTIIERSSAIATALARRIGYDAAASIAQRAQKDKRTIKEIVIEDGILTTDEANTVLDPLRMTRPWF